MVYKRMFGASLLIAMQKFCWKIRDFVESENEVCNIAFGRIPSVQECV